MFSIGPKIQTRKTSSQEWRNISLRMVGVKSLKFSGYNNDDKIDRNNRSTCLLPGNSLSGQDPCWLLS